MAIEDLGAKIKSEKRKPTLKLLRGGKFDDSSLIRKIEKILPRVQNTKNVEWLIGVFNQSSELLKDSELKPEETDRLEKIVSAAALRLSELGHPIKPQEEKDRRTRYNV